MKMYFVFFVLYASLLAQDVIDISVKGVSDEKNDGTQRDRLEAIMDAKRQACEKAGMKIESKTTVENFEIINDLIESKAETVLLPGFQIIDIGYVQDGTYQVVLTGKIKVLKEDEAISAKELRYAKSLKDRGKYAQCEQILKKYINSDGKDVPEALKEEAFYLYIKWGFSFNPDEDFNKFAAFFPQSRHLSKLENFIRFAVNPVYDHSKTYSPTSEQWLDKEFIYKKNTFTKQINVVRDTIVFKDFKQQDQSLLLTYTLFSSKDEKPVTGYELKLDYYDGNLKLVKDESIQPVELVEIDHRFKIFKPGSSETFQHSSSGKWFNHFKLKNYQISGNVPRGAGPFKQKLQFTVYQRSF